MQIHHRLQLVVAAALMAASSAALAQAGQTVKLAFMDPLSGPFANVGQNQLKSWQFSAEHFNKKNAAGVKFEIVPFDNKGSPQESLNTVKAAIDQDIRYIVQGMTSSVANHGETLAPLMRKANFKYVFLGIENVVEDDLTFLHARAKNRERATGGLPKGSIVTLAGRVFEADGAARPWVLPRDHGTLESMRSEARPTTALDWEALHRVWAHGTMGPERPAVSAFGRQWDDAVRERRERLVRAGFLVEEEREQGRALRLSRKAEAMMEDRGHERTPLNLEEVQKHSRKPVRPAPDAPGQHLSGRLEAVAYDRENRQHAVLDTGRELTTIRTDQNDLQIGHEYEAQSRPERSAERRRLVAWQLDDLQRVREHDHGRGQ